MRDGLDGINLDRITSVALAMTQHARQTPDKAAIITLAEGEAETGRVTFGELDAKARALAGYLRSAGLTGERVMLLLPQDADYIVALIGCLYAGAVAVPAYPPAPGRRAGQLALIMADCQPALALTTGAELAAVHAELPPSCPVRCVEELTVASGSGLLAEPDPAVGPDQLAYLQYTSGSTSTPRGVLVSQHNVVHQSRLLAVSVAQAPGDVTVTWLPLYHDLGLICGMLYPLLVGSTVVLMPPAAFVMRPLRWLDAVSRYRAATTYSPNFALGLCCTKITPSERRALDLSCLRSVGVGAEPIQAETLEKFAEVFESSGFSMRAFRPGYGMAEATLTIAMHRVGDPLVIMAADAGELTGGRLVAAGPGSRRAVRLVGHGGPALDTELLIVTPGSGQPCPEGTEGEVWVGGQTVTAGYWKQADKTRQTFGGHLADGRGPFLRTGDLGIWQDGQLFITGRRKDLIIVNGSNHYPHDLERTVGAAHPALHPSRGAAFSVPAGGAGDTEGVVVVHELGRSYSGQGDLTEVVRSIQLAVSADHELALHAVALIAPKSLPMTLNGKIRRAEARRLYLAGELAVEHAWRDPAAVPAQDAGQGRVAAVSPGAEAAAITGWLIRRIAELRGLAAEQVSADAPFGSLGLDSAALLGLAGDLERWLGQPISPIRLYNYPTISRFARSLADDRPGSQAVTKGSDGQAGRPPGPALEPLAVVGMACQFPGAPSIEAFWDLLWQGTDATGERPASRPTAGHEPAPAGGSLPAGYIEGVDEFDAGFFGISPAEASSMDPQQRLLLTTTWRALEDAGISPDLLAGTRTGVFVGISGRDYWQLQAREARLDAYSGTGSALSIAANRLSHVFDLRGPSLAVDTACSSSLVALHQAAASLRLGECDLAIVGGVNLLLDSELTTVFRQAGMLAPDGRCKTFDAAADGYARGEGCGVVILERQADAIGRGDRVQALVRGSAVSQDGQSSSLTTPSGLAQELAIRQAIAAARLEPGQVGYVEAHGTGTSLGDPIELAALREVYGRPEAAGPQGAGPQWAGPLWVGSVKPNIGHLEAAAGIAGFIKVVLALRHQAIPAQVHLTQVNPRIDLAGSRLQLPRGRQDWPAGPWPRTGAVSSFGFGGTNAHVIVTESVQNPAEPNGHADDTPADDPAAVGATAVGAKASDAVADRAWRLLPVSARDSSALTRLASDYLSLLDGPAGDQTFGEICDTAGARRAHHRHRLAVLAPSGPDAAAVLRKYLAGRRQPDAVTGLAGPDRGPVVFLFTGQGSQYPGMAARLYHRYALLRRVLDACDAIAADLLGTSLLPAMCGTAGTPVDLDQTLYAQPAVFMTDYALASLWQACGLRPDYLLGHSLGEYVAACVAGVLSLPDAIALVVRRGQLMQEQASPGAMYSVHARDPVLTELCEAVRAEPGPIAIAAFNGPENVVISGDADLTGQWAASWQQRGARITRLVGTRAFHSPLVSAAAAEFGRLAEQVTHRAARIPVVSNVTGELLASDALTAGYWTRHSLAPVQFAAGLRTLGALGCTTFVEAGPQPVLSTLGATVLPDAAFLVSTRRGDADDRCFQRSLGRWYAGGGMVDWTGLRQARLGPQALPPPPARLPGYPLARDRYWYRAEDGAAKDGAAQDGAAQDGAAPDGAAPDGAAKSGAAKDGRSPAGELELTAKPAAAPGAAYPAPLRCYDWSWEPAPPDRRPLAELPGPWLVAGADSVTVRQWCSQLEAGGHPAIGVILAPASPNSPDLAEEAQLHRVDPESAGSIDRFFAGLRSAGTQIGGLVLHGGPFAAPGEDDPVPELVHRLARQAFLLLRHFLAAYAARRPQLIICSSGAVATGLGSEVPDLGQGVLTAMARAVAAEYADLACVQVDLDQTGAAPPLPALLERAIGRPGSGHLAVRGGSWYLARLRESDLPDQAATPPIRPDATYLVTGGLGGLGLAVARWLADSGARCLLLAGRSVPAEPSALVAALRERGVRVVIRAADVSDPDSVADVLRCAGEELPALRGIFHAAGVIADASLENLDWPRFAEVLAPKVTGAWQLHRQTRDLDLDFFVSFSSLAALTGSAGQASYLVANTFLDTLARYRRQLGQPALSIGWGPWSQTGLAARPELLARFAARGIGGIATDQALDALGRMLTAGPAHAGVARLDTARLRASRGRDSLLDGVGEAAADAPLTAGSLTALAISDPDAAREILLDGLLDRAAAVLGLSEAACADLRPTFRYLHLQELGLDSLMAAQLRRQLLADFAADVPPENLFGEATVADTIEIILGQLTVRSVIAADDATATSAETEVLTL